MDSQQSWFEEQAQITLARILPRIRAELDNTSDAQAFIDRLTHYFPRFFVPFFELYRHHYDFFYHVEQALMTCVRLHKERSSSLRALDEARSAEPSWFQSETMVGAVAYVDLFAGDLARLRERIPYLSEMGVTYLHLMPLYAVPEPYNDGGYAVSSFREVNPKLGTMAELSALAAELRASGISLVLDFVFNHTSDEHTWAKQALAGSARHQAFYRMFNDRTIPDTYAPNLREIFPEQAPGSFTFRPDLQKWVWTTFYPFQWDLNYSNPDLFVAMLEEMLFLANAGAEVLRLDAVPFIWKELGTNCENRPEAHLIIQAYNALVRIAAPSLLFKSEAIVHPRDVRSYIGPEECQLSYNPIMMVALWEVAATRDVTLFTHSMRQQFPLPEGTAWLNYLRSHDDIGWGFADEDAAAVGINGYHHRYFLNQFYSGSFDGTFARGLPFNFNPRTLDMRICGTLASLAGLEQAVESGNEALLDSAVNRIIAMFSVVISAGGIPLIYLGDELGTLNDHAYLDDPFKADDSRWVHRPFANEARMARRHERGTVEGRIFTALQRMIQLRKRLPVLANTETHWLDSGNRHVLAFSRHRSLLALVNFSDFEEQIDWGTLQSQDIALVKPSDLISGRVVSLTQPLTLQPYEVLWLMSDDQARSST